MKSTAVAPSNIAFIKYWGRKDEELRLPENGSISMNLSNLLTTTTVEFNTNLTKDEVIIDGQENEREVFRVSEHLDRIRKMASISTFAKVTSINNFPSSTGLSSSASGFAALTVAGTHAAGLTLTDKELSILARLGSGSACRSIPDGFTEWLDGNTNETSYAKSLYPKNYWDISDIVAVASNEKKSVSTTAGQKLSSSSPFFETRLNNISDKIIKIKERMKEKDFTKFGEILEAEALEIHSIMLTSKPSLIYLLPNSLRIILEVKKMRNEGVEAYFTLNTGQDVHVICESKNKDLAAARLKTVDGVSDVIINSSANGARISEDHLF